MSYEMIYRLPIQERRMMIQRYNADAEAMERDTSEGGSSDIRRYEGEQINEFARLEQNNQRGG